MRDSQSCGERRHGKNMRVYGSYRFLMWTRLGTVFVQILLTCRCCLGGIVAIEWERDLGRSGWAYDVQQTRGGFILTGFSDFSDTGSRFFLLKTDQEGNPLWWRRYPSDIAYGVGRSVLQTEDGGFFAVGSGAIRTDEDGRLLWILRLEGFATSALSVDSGYIVAGITPSSDDSATDVFLLRMDTEGGIHRARC